jgi:outer membrane protein assembly factor BamB
VLWKNTKQVPFCASPLVDGGHVFTVKDGGFLSCLDAKTGNLLKRDRLPASGNYYSSPVAGDGKIYLLNERGQVCVVKAAKDWEVLGTADFGEDVYATPAIADGKIYLRTAGHLYCFGLPAGK